MLFYSNKSNSPADNAFLSCFLQQVCLKASRHLGVAVITTAPLHSTKPGHRSAQVQILLAPCKRSNMVI